MRTTGVLLLVVVMAAIGCHKPVRNNMPPSEMLMHPGPGVDGPGPGVMLYQPPAPPINAVSQVQFVGPEGMCVQWDVTAPGRFDSEPLIAPARYNFPQGAIYRLKIGNIPGRPGIELYPTLELAYAVPTTAAYLAHNSVAVQFTEEDFDQVQSGNFVTKVIYLPDPEFQEAALAGPDILVSTRLDPGVDPVVEADRRGAILGIVRLGNKDEQLPGGGVMENGIHPAAYQAAMGGPCPRPSPYVAGVTAPQYGMPMSGTPIGLVGPPHVPLGVPAGLQQHSIVNHTRVNLPEPSHSMRIDVKQKPGMSYPQPADHARIVERTALPGGRYLPPRGTQYVDPGTCPEGTPAPAGDPGAGTPANNCQLPTTVR